MTSYTKHIFAAWLIINTFVAIAGERCDVKILSQDGGNYILEVTVDQFTISTDENGHHLVTIDGLPFNNEAGKPRLPVKGILLSVPAYSEFDLVFLAEDFELKTDIDLSPNLTPEFTPEDNGAFEQKAILKKDSKIYGANDFYPAKPVALNILGFMRDQYLLRIMISPAQYNPVQNVLKLHKRIRFQIKQQELAQADLSLPKSSYHRDESSPVFDQALGNQILNSKQVNAATLPFKFKQDTGGGFDAIKFYSSLAGQNPIKIIVSQDGMYKLSYLALKGSGLDLSFANPQNIRLFNQGREIPIYIAGEDDEKFDTDDFVIFYGQANKTIYSDQNVYWMVVGEQRGLRMQTKDGQLLNSVAKLNRYKAIEHIEANKLYKHEMPFRKANEDHWVWDEIKPNEKHDYRFQLSHIDASEESALLRVLLYSRDNWWNSFKFSLNGNDITDTTWSHGSNFSMQRAFPQSYLNEGENLLTLKSFGRDGIVCFEWFEIAYWKTMAADQGKIAFALPQGGNFQLEINGFTSPLIDTYEIQDTARVFRITNAKTIQDGERYTLYFETAGEFARKFICTESNKYLAPNQILIDEPSDLYSISKQSDYVILTHESFYNNVLRLAELHRSEGLSVEVVKVQDIYDEFNYGIFDPVAIRNFLQYAYYFWLQPSPTYVLLVGDATYDYKDYLGLGLPGHVPTHLFENYYVSYQTSNDNWFVCVSGKDVLPDMMIGRLPTRSSSELDNIIQKIFDYKYNYLHSDSKRSVLIVADDSPSKEGFEKIGDSLSYLLPKSFQVKSVYLRNFARGENCRDEVTRSIDRGCLIATYVGHGAPDFWATERIFRNNDVEYLNNRYMYPFMFTLTCLNGLFEHPARDCIGEKLIKTRNGAIASWAATGFVFISQYLRIGSYLYDAIFTNQDLRFGSFVTQAKLGYWASGGLPDHVEMYTLFGDPALKLNVINPDAPIVEWRFENQPLSQEEQFVQPDPLFVATIRSTHALIPELIEITLDGRNIPVNDPMITYLPSSHNLAEVQLQTNLKEGSHHLRIVVSDSAGLKGEDRIQFHIQENELSIASVMNYPNPMRDKTYFTYELSQPAEVIIKIYTISGRLIQILNDYSMTLFNTIEWDGRDKDGDNIANGVYLYKVIAKTASQTKEIIEKLAKIE